MCSASDQRGHSAWKLSISVYSWLHCLSLSHTHTHSCLSLSPMTATTGTRRFERARSPFTGTGGPSFFSSKTRSIASSTPITCTGSLIRASNDTREGREKAGIHAELNSFTSGKKSKPRTRTYMTTQIPEGPCFSLSRSCFSLASVSATNSARTTTCCGRPYHAERRHVLKKRTHFAVR